MSLRRKPIIISICIIIVTIGLTGCGFKSSDSENANFRLVNTNPMARVRANHTATSLSDSAVLLVGGAGGACSVEIYTIDSHARIIRDGTGCRMGHTAIVLKDNTILVTGGVNGLEPSATILATSELFKMPDGIGISTGGLITARFNHTATMLPDGTVLITGGYIEDENDRIISTRSAEVYNPDTNEFTTTQDMNVSRVGHSSTILSNGSVLVLGGTTSNAIAEIYQPWTKQFRLVEVHNIVRFDHTATILADDTVLILGGIDENASTLSEAMLFDPGDESFSMLDPMKVARVGHTSSLLVDGRVVVTGGNGINSWALASIEIYDPLSGQFSLLASLSRPRVGHTATLVNDGLSVLISGGWSTLKLTGPILLKDMDLIDFEFLVNRAKHND